MQEIDFWLRNVGFWLRNVGKKQTANFAGHSDWRLPMIEELRTLTYCSNGKPAYFNNGKPGEEEDKVQGKSNNFDWRCRGKAGKDYDEPTIVQSVFPNTPSYSFWSGSPVSDGAVNAWVVNFSDGDDYNYSRYGNEHVRLVRGGQ